MDVTVTMTTTIKHAVTDLKRKHKYVTIILCHSLDFFGFFKWLFIVCHENTDFEGFI